MLKLNQWSISHSASKCHSLHSQSTSLPSHSKQPNSKSFLTRRLDSAPTQTQVLLLRERLVLVL